MVDPDINKLLKFSGPLHNRKTPPVLLITYFQDSFRLWPYHSWPDLEWAASISDNTDVIVIAIMGSETGLAAKEKRKWQEIPVIKAVRDNRVHVVDPDLVYSPSPATFAATRAVFARLIHPELNSLATQ